MNLCEKEVKEIVVYEYSDLYDNLAEIQQMRIMGDDADKLFIIHIKEGYTITIDPENPLPPLSDNVILFGPYATIDFQGGPGLTIEGSQSAVMGEPEAMLTLQNFSDYGVKASCVYGVSVLNTRIFCASGSSGVRFNNTLFSCVQFNQIVPGQMECYYAGGLKFLEESAGADAKSSKALAPSHTASLLAPKSTSRQAPATLRAATYPSDADADKPNADLEGCQGWAGIEIVSEGQPCAQSVASPCKDYPCLGSALVNWAQALEDGGMCGKWIDYVKSHFDRFTTSVGYNQVGTGYQEYQTKSLPAFAIGIDVRGGHVEVIDNQVAVSKQTGISIKGVEKGAVRFNYVGLERNCASVATPYVDYVTDVNRLFGTGILVGCDNGDIALQENIITLFGEGMRVTQGPCGNTSNSPRASDGDDPSDFLTTHYTLEGNRFGTRDIQLSEGVQGVVSLNVIGLVSEGRGDYADCKAVSIEVPSNNQFVGSARTHVLTTDKLNVPLWGCSYAAGAKTIDYECLEDGMVSQFAGSCLEAPNLSVELVAPRNPASQNIILTVTGRPGAIVQIYGLTDSSLGYGAWVVRHTFELPSGSQASVTIPVNISFTDKWYKVAANQTLSPWGTSAFSTSQDTQTWPGLTCTGFAGWGGHFGPGWPGGHGWPTDGGDPGHHSGDPGGPGDDDGTGLGDLCYGIETYDPNPAAQLYLPNNASLSAGSVVASASQDGYMQYTFSGCGPNATRASVTLNQSLPPGTRIDWFLGDAPPSGVPTSSDVGTSYGTSPASPWSLTSAPLDYDPKVRWAVISPSSGINRLVCRRVFKFVIDNRPLTLVGDTLFPATCGPRSNGGFSFATASPLTVRICNDPSGTQCGTYVPVTINIANPTPKTICRIRSLPAGTYWVFLSTSGSCPGSQRRKVVIPASQPELVMNCNPVLPCRPGPLDSVEVPFRISWPGLPRVTGSGSPYTNIMYEVTVVDTKRLLPSWVKRGHLNSDGETGKIMIAYADIRPQHPYAVYVRASGFVLYPNSNCSICGQYEEICSASSFITFERLGLTIRPTADLDLADGFFHFPFCPNTAALTPQERQERQAIKLNVSWRRSDCNTGINQQGVRLTTKFLSARGGILITAPTPADVGQTNLPLPAPIPSPTLAFTTLAYSKALPVPGSEGIYRRYVVEGMGCSDSIDVRVQPVDTSFRVAPQPLNCFDVIGGRPASWVLTSIGQGAYASYRWDTLASPIKELGLEGPNVRLPEGTYQVRAHIQTTVGNCPTRLQPFNLRLRSLPALTVDYEKLRNGQPTCAIHATFDDVASHIPADQRSRQYEIIWTAQNRGGIPRHSTSATFGASVPDHNLGWVRYLTQPRAPWDTLILVAHGVFDANRDRLRLDSRLENPIDSSRYRAFLVDAETGCMSRSNTLSYVKPDASRKFTLVVGWGPDKSKPIRDTTPGSGGLAPAMIATLARQQAACLSDAQALATQLADLSALRTQGLLDTLALGYQINSQVATLMVYDKGGRLVSTVPPNGLVPLTRTSTFNHNLRSRYEYTSMGFRIKEQTPDLGTTLFWPDKVGRIRFSQTAQDLAEASSGQAGAYRYSVYDGLGRITETGRIAPNQTFNTSWSTINDIAWTPVGLNKTEYITSKYDDGTQPWQTFTRSRVTEQARSQPDGRSGTALVTTYYSYDPHGAVKRLQHDIVMPAHSESHDIRYRYDLISGRVRELWVDSGQTELSFGQRYRYDSDGRLLLEEAAQTPLHFEPQAKYYYYAHGPLRRLELGSEHVQGLDYLYTLQGWLKAVNGGIAPDINRDPSLDGFTNSAFAPDVFAQRLDYFSNDFKLRLPTGRSLTSAQSTDLAGSLLNSPLFDGNISAQHTAVADASGINSLKQAYRYDALARIHRADNYKNIGQGGIFSSEYTYDEAGNLLSLKRRDGTATEIDNLTYAYPATAGVPTSNRLTSVSDQVTGSDGVASGSHGFTYDAEGRLIERQNEHQQVAWTMDNKVRQVLRKNSAGTSIGLARWIYDASGNQVARLTSPVTGAGVPTGTDTASFTIREAEGRELIRIETGPDGAIVIGPGVGNAPSPGTAASPGNNSNPIFYHRTEAHIYGSAHLGLYEASGQVDPDTAYRRSVAIRYLLADHLGNVRAEVSGQKQADHVANSQYNLTARILSQRNYYPFGMPIEEQSLAGSRFGYNGKPADKRLGGVTAGGSYDYGFRAYDAGLARFFSVDPLRAKYPELTPYQFASNRPIDGIDQDGLEWTSSHDALGRPAGYHWDPQNACSADGNLNQGYYNQAIFFSSNGDRANTNYNLGQSTATVYLNDGSTQTFIASTLPSRLPGQPTPFATVPEGEYEANNGPHHGRPALQMSDIGQTNRRIALDEPNIATGNMYIEFPDIHWAGRYDQTSAFYKEDKAGRQILHGVSEACFLLGNDDFPKFLQLFPSGNGPIGVSVSRTYSTPQENFQPLPPLDSNDKLD